MKKQLFAKKNNSNDSRGKKKSISKVSSSKKSLKKSFLKPTLMANKLSTTIQGLTQVKPSQGKKVKSKNLSLFKKYLNPMNKKLLLSSDRNQSNTQDEGSVQLKRPDKKSKRQQRVFKKKKTVNYTTIRKQLPSFEHSVESASSGIRILKYPKPNKNSTISSNSGSMIMLSNIKANKKNMNTKSQNYSIFKNNSKDSKIIRMSLKDSKANNKSKQLKTSKKGKISKYVIDLFKTNPARSSRIDNSGSKEYSSNREDIKTVSSNKSKSSERKGTTSAKGDVFPMPPGKALKLFMQSKLTTYEHSEILDYEQVYFIGNAEKKIDGTKNKKANCGYDDEMGHYNLTMHDHIAFRYEILNLIGQGSFGRVLTVLDHKTNKTIALKIIRNKKKFEYQAGIEIKVLKDIKNNDLHDKSNIIKLSDNFIFRNHICMTFAKYSINLYELIKLNHMAGFPLDIIRRFAVQILQGLRFLKKRSIIHCDLKPENIILKRKNKSGIKIIDLGSS